MGAVNSRILLKRRMADYGNPRLLVMDNEGSGKDKEQIMSMHTWTNTTPGEKLMTNKLYKEIMGIHPEVVWKKAFYDYYARPRALFCLWMGCQGKLQTKDRLIRFGVPTDGKCVFCDESESMNHLFFQCTQTKAIWLEVLVWMKVNHVPVHWNEELSWMIKAATSKSARGKILKMALAETVYLIWNARNKVIFCQ